MKKLCVAVVLLTVSLGVLANSTIFTKLSESNGPSAKEILANIEQNYADKGVIVEFELEEDDGQTTYEVSLYDKQNHRFIEMTLDDKGDMLEFEYEKPELDQDEEIAAANLLKSKKMTLSELVQKLSQSPEHYLLEAQLEQDMGVTYMVATFVTEQGRHKKAIDLNTLKSLPLLRWGN